ncbi:GntR family transcriptional regulator [Bacillus sp. SA1-12]|uniref:GntR family transcriptional regulator n=1 Tax=Bacillus sp. SA1-12 TaxID=1455638 RepID=UPI00069725A9|nr:GntR family transcriptional regulator [Bacillus sp. SA1-12]
MLRNTHPFKLNENPFGESLPEQIAKYILEKIIKDELHPGDKIVEEYIAQELNTSRAPVREALYLLQIDNIVERIPRKGTLVKSFTDYEIREYTEVMIGLIQMALDFTKEKWTPNTLQSLDEKFTVMSNMFHARELLGYQESSSLLTNYIFEVAGNKALSKFYYESVYILNVFAKVKWTKETMIKFHPKMENMVILIKENQINRAKDIIPNLLLETLNS